MARCNAHNAKTMLDFLLKRPCEDQIIDMDCNDYCEQLADLAEQVASGANLADLLPLLEEHMHHWKDCREEFDALVAILRAEKSGQLANPGAAP